MPFINNLNDKDISPANTGIRMIIKTMPENCGARIKLMLLVRYPTPLIMYRIPMNFGI